MEEELSTLKTELRSIVVSSRQEMNVSRLRKDYRELFGCDIPCGTFNYRDINTFLRERLDDCFLFKGDYRNPTLTPIVPDSMKHIDKMIQCQNSKMRGPKRTSVYESPSSSGKDNCNERPSSIQFRNSSPNVTSGNSNFGSYRNYPKDKGYISPVTKTGPPNPVTNAHQSPKPVTSFKHDVKLRGPTHQPNHTDIYPSPTSNKSPVTATHQPPKPVTSFRHDFNMRAPNHTNNYPSPTANKALVTATHQPPKPETSFQNDFNMRGATQHPNHTNTYPSPTANKAPPCEQPVQPKTTPKPDHQLVFTDIPSLHWTPSGSSLSSSLCRESPPNIIKMEEMRGDSRQSFNRPSSSNSSKGKSPGSKSKRTILRDSFLKLGELNPNGIWAKEFNSKYKETFGTFLNVNALGYQSMTLMCSAFPDCWIQVKPSPAGDTLILPIGCITTNRDTTSHLVRMDEPVMQAFRKFESTMLDMSPDPLPGVEFDAYPPNALQFHEIIELLDLPETLRVESAEFEIEVAEVCNPTHFWYLLYSPKHSVALFKMINDMNDFYDSPAGDEYKIRYQAAKPKIFCAARYHADWQRAQMLTYCVNNQLKVRHIDFGTIAYLNISEVRFLKREWADLPAQAMRGRLSGIRPDSLDKEWPLKATRFFLRLILEKRVIATTCSYDDEDKVLDMFITDTSRDEDIHITDELVGKGLARICSEEEADDYRAADSSLFEKYEQCRIEHFHHLVQLDYYEIPVTNDPPGHSIDYDEDALEKLLAKVAPCKPEHFTAVLLNDLFSAARKKGQEEIQMPDETEEGQEGNREDEPLVDITLPTEIPVLPTWPYSNFPTLSHDSNLYFPHPHQPMQPVENQPRPVKYPHQPPRPVEYPHQPLPPVENPQRTVEYSQRPLRSIVYPHQPLQSVENPSRPVEYPHQPPRLVEYSHQPLQPVENPHQPPRPVEYFPQPLRWPVEYPPSQPAHYPPQRPIESNKYPQLGYPQYPPRVHPHAYDNPLMFDSPPSLPPHPFHPHEPYFPPGFSKSYLDSARRRFLQYNAAPQNTFLRSSPPPNAVPPQNVLPQNTSRRNSVDATAIVRPEWAVQLQPRAAKQTTSTESQTVPTTKFENTGFWNVNATEFVLKKSYSIAQTATKTNSDESERTSQPQESTPSCRHHKYVERIGHRDESERASQPEESTPSCRNDKYIEHIGHRELYGKRVNIYKCNGKVWLSPHQMMLLFWKDKNVKAPESLFKFKAILREKLTEDVYSMHSVTIDEFGRAFLMEGFFEFSDEKLAICKDVLIPVKRALNFAIIFEHLLDIIMFDLLTLVSHAMKMC